MLGTAGSGNQAELFVGGKKQLLMGQVHDFQIGQGGGVDAHQEVNVPGAQSLSHGGLPALDDLDVYIRVDGAEGGEKQGEPVMPAYLADADDQGFLRRDCSAAEIFFICST